MLPSMPPPSLFAQVAIKTLKASGEAETEEFLAEAHLMTKLEHKNLVRLIGVVTSTNPIMMVFEYMSKVCVCVCVCVFVFVA
jgi:serine/threonine protein kinase